MRWYQTWSLLSIVVSFDKNIALNKEFPNAVNYQYFSSDSWLGHALIIGGTFLPQAGEDFWLGPFGDDSVFFGTEELDGDPTAKYGAGLFTVDRCPGNAEAEAISLLKDICVWPWEFLRCPWGMFTRLEVVGANETPPTVVLGKLCHWVDRDELFRYIEIFELTRLLVGTLLVIKVLGTHVGSLIWPISCICCF